MPARYVDPEKSRGNLEPANFSFGLSDAIVETGLPCDRRYDFAEELARIRQIYLRTVGGHGRPASRWLVSHSFTSPRRMTDE